MKFKNNYHLLLLLGTFYSNVSAAEQEASLAKEAIFKKSYEGLFTPNTVLAMPTTPPTERKPKGSILKSLASSVAASATLAASSAKVAHELAPKAFKRTAATATGVGTFCWSLATQHPFSEEIVITKASQDRAKLMRHFDKIRKIDEKIAAITGSNSYFVDLLHNEHECSKTCKDNCSTNDPLTKMSLRLDSQNIAQFSLLTTERAESLRKLRDLYKKDNISTYSLEQAKEQEQDISDSEEEDDEDDEDEKRISTKKMLKKQIRHTNKVYNTVYHKIDEHHKNQVPVIVEKLTDTQQQAQAQQVQNTQSNSYLSMASNALPAILNVVAQTLLRQ